MSARRAKEMGIPKKDEVFFWEEEGHRRIRGIFLFEKFRCAKIALTSTSVLEEIKNGKQKENTRTGVFFFAGSPETQFLVGCRGNAPHDRTLVSKT